MRPAACSMECQASLGQGRPELFSMDSTACISCRCRRGRDRFYQSFREDENAYRQHIATIHCAGRSENLTERPGYAGTLAYGRPYEYRRSNISHLLHSRTRRVPGQKGQGQAVLESSVVLPVFCPAVRGYAYAPPELCRPYEITSCAPWRIQFKPSSKSVSIAQQRQPWSAIDTLFELGLN